MEQEIRRLREAWLSDAAVYLLTSMRNAGMKVVQVRVSCGWPSHGGMGQGRHVIGQCFPPQLCADGIPQIFISPRIAESVQVLGVLLHELIHACVGNECGHGAGFSQPARKLGLVGPPTATTVGPRLQAMLDQYIAHVGAYPHAPIQVVHKPKKGSRLRLYECSCDPVVKVRVASNEFLARCLRCHEIFHRVEREGGTA
jgi:hypothetical protein